MDIHTPRRSLCISLTFTVRRNPVGTYVARAAAKRTATGNTRAPVRGRQLGEQNVISFISNRLKMRIRYLLHADLVQQ